MQSGGGGRRFVCKATQVHAGTRAGSVCQTAGKPAKGGGGGWAVDCVDVEVVEARGRGCFCAFRLVLILLSQIDFGSAHSLSLL